MNALFPDTSPEAEAVLIGPRSSPGCRDRPAQRGGLLLLVYIKRVEEKEMELRFSQEYLNYRQRTPFLLPRFRN